MTESSIGKSLPIETILKGVVVFCYSLTDLDYPWPNPEAEQEARKKVEEFYLLLPEVERKSLPQPQKPEFYPALAKLAWDKLKLGREELFHQNLPSPGQLKEWEEAMDKQRAELQKAAQKARATRPSLETQLAQARKRIQERIKDQLLTSNPQLKDQPLIAEETSRHITEALEAETPAIAAGGKLPEADLEEISQKATPEIERELALAGISPEKVGLLIKPLIKTSLSEMEAIAMAPARERIVAGRAKVTMPVSPKIPPEVLAKLTPESRGIAFQSVFIGLYPPAAANLVIKVGLVPVVKPWQWTAKLDRKMYPGARLAFLHGITFEDVVGSIKKLVESGLPDDHPQVDELKKIRDSAHEFEEKHPILLFLTKKYHEYSRVTNQVAAKTGVPFLNRQPPDWVSQKGYAWQLREGLNNLGLFSRLYQWLPTEGGGKIIRFIPQEKLAQFFSKISQPVLAWLGKTGLGTALKIGAKKVAGWLAARLGIEAGLIAAGTAVAPGVGTVISAIAGFLVEKIGKPIWDKIKFLLYNLINKKEGFLGLIGLGILGLIILPKPVVFIVAIPFALGGLGLAAWGTTGAGGFLGGFTNGIGGFFTALTLAPISAAPAILIGGILGGLSLLTFLIVMITAGAFILPVSTTLEGGRGAAPPSEPPIFAPPLEISFIWPIASLRCSSNYGYRTLEGDCVYHTGIDISTNIGTPVRATAKGTVVDVGYNNSYGNYVIVDHGGLYSLYAHLSGPSVYKGNEIEQGATVGLAGFTGRTTGPHLHLAFSDCAEMPRCFNDGSHTPDPCNYLNCPAGCSYQNRAVGCSGL